MIARICGYRNRQGVKALFAKRPFSEHRHSGRPEPTLAAGQRSPTRLENNVQGGCAHLG